jgi:hypothetical protein
VGIYNLKNDLAKMVIILVLAEVHVGLVKVLKTVNLVLEVVYLSMELLTTIPDAEKIYRKLL